MFDPSERLRPDVFAQYHAATRIKDERAAVAEAERQVLALRQQNIREAAEKRAALARPEPRYQPCFPVGL